MSERREHGNTGDNESYMVSKADFSRLEIAMQKWSEIERYPGPRGVLNVYSSLHVLFVALSDEHPTHL